MFLKKNLSHGRIYLNLVEGYTENGKTKHRVIEKLGFLDELEKIYEDPIDHFRKIAKERTKEKEKIRLLKINTEQEMKVGTNNLRFMGYFPFKKLFGKLRLQTFFNNLQRGLKITYNLGSIFLFLVISRILHPSSVKKAYESKDCYFEKFNFTLKQVYRAYDYFAKFKDRILKYLYKSVSRIYNYQTNYCRYDVTNYYFEIRYDDLDEYDEDGVLIREGKRKKGYSKENRRTPIIQMGLLLDENGIPMSYNLFPGNRSEKKSLRPLLSQLKRDFQIGRMVVIADRGINTDSNCAMLTQATGDGYIYGNSIRREDASFKEWVLNQDDYIIDELDEVDAKTGRPVIFKHKSWTGMVNKKIYDDNGRLIGEIPVKEKVMVYYSRKYADRERKQRERYLKKAEGYLKNPGNYTRATSKGAAGYVKEVEEEEKKDNKKRKKQKKLEIDYDKIQEEEKYDGYFSIITSEVEMSDKELRDAYKELWEIEETFKMTKSELETRPVYMSLQTHIEVHFLICYVALLLVKLLQYQLDKDVSFPHLLRSLRQFNCAYLEQNYFKSIYYDEVLEELAKHYHLNLNKSYLTRGEIKQILKYD